MQDASHPTTLPMASKNYVFVDEHNRQKRLKVIRACEACRRRKIKCDSATTNTWPCAGCIRLKLQCIPPAGTTAGVDQWDDQPALSYRDALDMQSMSAINHANLQFVGHSSAFQVSSFPKSPDSLTLATSFSTGYNPSTAAFPKQQRYDHTAVQQHIPQLQSQMHAQMQQYSGTISQLRPTTPSPVARQSSDELVHQLGVLAIQEDGVAEYVRQQNKDRKEPDVPRLEMAVNIGDFEDHPGSQVYIPSSLMPTDEEALRLFALFFIHVHPYMPVLCRSQFYDQWHNHRDSMSPLLLEAIFACATRVSENPDSCLRWLALAESGLSVQHDDPTILNS